jgi:hypothetical protein
MFLWALCKFLVVRTSAAPVASRVWPDHTAGGLPFGVYAIAQNFNIPLQVQPQVFMALCLVSWVQILLYHRYGACQC